MVAKSRIGDDFTLDSRSNSEKEARIEEKFLRWFRMNAAKLGMVGVENKIRFHLIDRSTRHAQNRAAAFFL